MSEINPELRQRLEERKRASAQTSAERELRMQHAQELRRASDAAFWIKFVVIAFVIFGIIGWLVE